MRSATSVTSLWRLSSATARARLDKVGKGHTVTMQDLITETSDLVTMTPVAAAKVRELLQAEGNPELALRVYVAGGGCSGLQYGMALDDGMIEGDTLVEYDGIRVLIDAESIGFIQGCEIDYVDSLM